MHLLWIIAAIATMLVGAIFSLTTLTFVMACGANSTPAQLAMLKTLLIIMLVAGGLGLVGPIVFMLLGRHGAATLAAALPIVASIAVTAYLFAIG